MHQPPQNATTRFSDRVDNYVRYRPSYPSGVRQILQEETGLTPTSIVADIGSGTGISTQLFLSGGNQVFAVEPNAEMRLAAEAQLGSLQNFHSIDARSEATTLPTASIDYVVAGQAFHWFDRQKARQEFARILRPGGWIVLLWNSRRTDSSPFLRAYEHLLQKFGTDYRAIEHKQIDAAVLESFFAKGKFTARTIDNQQRFDLGGIKGRLLSSSYAPNESHANYPAMISELERIFNVHNEDGQVCIEYDTELYFGKVD
jgi:SAM-dependent methyltransferase